MYQQKNRVAIMYDFDKTLTYKDMQEYSFQPGGDRHRQRPTLPLCRNR